MMSQRNFIIALYDSKIPRIDIFHISAVDELLTDPKHRDHRVYREDAASIYDKQKVRNFLIKLQVISHVNTNFSSKQKDLLFIL